MKERKKVIGNKMKKERKTAIRDKEERKKERKKERKL